MRRGIVGLASLAVVATVPAAAQEEGSSLRPAEARVTWSGSPEALGCPPALALEIAISEALGRPLAATGWDVTAAIEIVAHDDEHVGARIALGAADGTILGTRTIETDDPTCVTVAEGLALVVAMLVDLHQRAAVIRMARREERATIAPWRVGVAAHAALDVGWLPRVGWKLGAEVTVGPPALVRALVRASVVVPQTSWAEGDPRSTAPSAEVWGATGAAGACVQPALGPIEFGGCLALEGGWLSVQGGGLDTPRASDAGHLALQATARFLAPVGDALVLGLEVGASVLFLRQRFVYTQGAEIVFFESSPVTFGAALIVGAE